ncbi:hypothetical protein ACIA8K_12755 [Catenuloplanes sp. NPDC051500]|uniref:hypothetical protein n=1 Tax=Catenuloplanes sp. NPDC051500 TaxID=3363959 RepID=UPI0037B42775
MTYTVALQYESDQVGWITAHRQYDVQGQADTDNAKDVGIDWALNESIMTGMPWRVMVYSTETGKVLAVVEPDDLTKTTGAPQRVARIGKKRIPPRVHGPVGDVVAKVRVTPQLLGRAVLVSQDRANRVGTGTDGWHLASWRDEGTHIARVRSLAEHTVQGVTQLVLMTDHGRLFVPAASTAIPA